MYSDCAFDILGQILSLIWIILLLLILIIRTILVIDGNKVKLTKRIRNGCRTSKVQKQRMGNLSHSVWNIFVRFKGSRTKQLPEEETIKAKSLSTK